jgi:serine/threonine protein kinase
LGSGGFGEVWKCEAPGGLLKAVKFVSGSASALEPGSAPAEEELRAIQRVKAIRHPFLLSMERVEIIDGELVIVLELADRSLHDLLTEYRRAGREGLPRGELLGYLRETAEALDLMNLRYGLQHLDIKPRNLFLVSNHVKVGDFGLVNTVTLGAQGQPTAPHRGSITPLYAAPEILQGTMSRSSDQYSLALVYHELLAGGLPFEGKNARQLLLERLRGEPDLHRLPTSDWPAVARALARNPDDRFPSCSDFVLALLTAQNRRVAATPGTPQPSPACSAGRPASARAGARANQGGISRTGRAPPSAEALAGHQLLACLRCTPLSETWAARAPDGADRLVRVLYGFGLDCDAAINRLQALHHPTLVRAEVLQSTPGRLVLACARAGRTLRDRLQECQAEAQSGIPRDELLGYLRAAAEALDHLHHAHGVQHVGLNPRCLFLDGERLLIGEFGWSQLLWLPAGQPASRLNPRYAAPELLQNNIHPTCDQYSLALLYHELLTGTHARQFAPGPANGVPDLSRLLGPDRDVLSRALNPCPDRRWSGCIEMIGALETVPTQRATQEVRSGRSETMVLTPQAMIRLNSTSGSDPARAQERYATRVGESPASETSIPGAGLLEVRFTAGLPVGVIRLRLHGFCQQWNGQVIADDERQFAFRMRTPRSLWQRWLGRQPGLEIHIELSAPPAAAATDVAVEIRPQAGGRKQGLEMLQVIGPLLLQSVRTFLEVNPKRRAQERLAWRHPLRAAPVHPDGGLGEPVECRGKDISLNGIGFYMPRQLATTHARLELPQTPRTPAMTVPVRIVRIQACGDGWYEAGAILLPPEPGIPPAGAKHC